MSSNAAMEIASAIQSASINRAPSPRHDNNPSTTASRKVPARITTQSSTEDSNASPTSPGDDADELSSPASMIPASALEPVPRRRDLPPLPEMRFEQSYLASLNGATDWKTIGYITLRDQVLLPLVSGMVWALALHGWKHWNRGTVFVGEGVGSKVRKWWWGVNNWEMPKEVKQQEKAKDVAEFYKNQFGSAAAD
ncbi:hypothetical protein MMC25_000578 [Agyrium rufum]|nr:hypothetical protein [Agyrium rufum]